MVVLNKYYDWTTEEICPCMTHDELHRNYVARIDAINDKVDRLDNVRNIMVDTINNLSAISEENAAGIKEYRKGVTEKYLDRRLQYGIFLSI